MRARDEGWFEGLFLACQPSIVKFVAYRVRNDDVVKDIVASTFEVAWMNKESIVEPELPYLLGIARNYVRRYWRSQQTAAFEISEFIEDSSLIEWGFEDERLERTRSARLLKEVLAQMSSTDAEILILSAWDGLDNDSIAKILGLTEVNARVRLHRAKRRAENILLKIDAEFVNEQINATRVKPLRRAL